VCSGFQRDAKPLVCGVGSVDVFVTRVSTLCPLALNRQAGPGDVRAFDRPLATSSRFFLAGSRPP
jgi:hypothetical protein